MNVKIPKPERKKRVGFKPGFYREGFIDGRNSTLDAVPDFVEIDRIELEEAIADAIVKNFMSFELKDNANITSVTSVVITHAERFLTFRKE